MSRKVENMTKEEKREALEQIMQIMPDELESVFTTAEIRMILMEICAFHVTGKFDTKPENIPCGGIGESFKDCVERLIGVWEAYN